MPRRNLTRLRGAAQDFWYGRLKEMCAGLDISLASFAELMGMDRQAIYDMGQKDAGMPREVRFAIIIYETFIKSEAKPLLERIKQLEEDNRDLRKKNEYLIKRSKATDDKPLASRSIEWLIEAANGSIDLVDEANAELERRGYDGDGNLKPKAKFSVTKKRAASKIIHESQHRYKAPKTYTKKKRVKTKKVLHGFRSKIKRLSISHDQRNVVLNPDPEAEYIVKPDGSYKKRRKDYRTRKQVLQINKKERELGSAVDIDIDNPEPTNEADI